jgi:hypothetical protein
VLAKTGWIEEREDVARKIEREWHLDLISELLGVEPGVAAELCAALPTVDFEAPSGPPAEVARGETFWAIEYSRALLALLIVGGREDLRWALRGLDRARAALQDVDAGVPTPAWLRPDLSHRPPASSYALEAQFQATVACDALLAFGRSPEDAAKDVAELLTKRRLLDAGRPVSARSVSRWWRERGGRGDGFGARVATVIYPRAFLPETSAQRRRVLLDELAAKLVRARRDFGAEAPITPQA